MNTLFLASTIIFLICGFALVHASTSSFALSLAPSSGMFQEGDTFWVDVFVDTLGYNVNAVGAYVIYPQDTLTPLAIDTSDSVFDIIVEKNYGNGRVEISGGKPTPGFSGVYKIASIQFTAVSSGTAQISFASDSAVLRDSDNQNIFTEGEGAIYTLSESGLFRKSFSQARQYKAPLQTFLANSSLEKLVSTQEALVAFLAFVGGLLGEK